MRRKPFTLVTLLGIRPDIIRMHKLLRLLDAGQDQYRYRHVFIHSGQLIETLGIKAAKKRIRRGAEVEQSLPRYAEW
jgi:hypothetical protein